MTRLYKYIILTACICFIIMTAGVAGQPRVHDTEMIKFGSEGKVTPDL